MSAQPHPKRHQKPEICSGWGHALGTQGTKWALFALLLSACAPRTNAQTPEAALAAYTRALDKGDPDRAYEFLSSEARLGISRAAFRDLSRKSPASVRAFAEALTRGDGTPKTIVTTSCGPGILLVYEDGKWRVPPEAIDVYPARTPREALRSLISAFDAGRMDVVHRLMPEARRKELSEAELREALTSPGPGSLASALDSLRLAVDDAPIELLGVRAAVAYGKGRTASLVLEGGTWKIESF